MKYKFLFYIFFYFSLYCNDIEIKDKWLELGVKRQLRLKETDKITKDDLAKLKVLQVTGVNISDEFKYFNSIERLFIHKSRIEDITLIKNLINLKTLHLEECDIVITEEFKNLINIEILNLSGNNITNIEPICSLYVHEIKLRINENDYVLIKDKKYDISGINDENILVDEEKKIFKNDEKFYYWYSVELMDNLDPHFLKGKVRSNPSIQVIQKYSFDNGKIKTEEIDYKVIVGRYKIDPNRILFYLYPP